MKLLYLLAPIALLSSCKQETAIPQTVKTEHIQTPTLPPALKKIAAELDGLWISDNYLTGIEKSRSIYKNKDYSTEVLGFSLYKDSLQKGRGDLLGFSQHEGGYQWPLKYNAATNSFNFDISRNTGYSEPREFSMGIENGRAKIRYTKPANKDEYYRRLGDNKEDIDLLDFELNRILFEGSYKDSISRKKVTFKRDGQMDGIENNSKYHLLYDFGEGLDFDIVFMWHDPAQKDQQDYHFKIEGTTIKLYTAIDKEDNMEYTISPLPSYVLIKQ